MTTAFPVAGLDFLRDLDANNNKEWFHANKKRYEHSLKLPGRALVDAVNGELSAISPSHVTPAGKAISRINRDIRFSKDKTPYNVKLWAGFHDASQPKGASAGYYFGFGLEDVGVGAGAWMPPKEYIGPLRAHIAEHHADLEAILADLPSEYTELKGEKYKRVPKPFPPDHPAGEWLKHKGFHIGRSMPLDVVTTENFVPLIGQAFRELKPLVDFLGAGLAG